MFTVVHETETTEGGLKNITSVMEVKGGVILKEESVFRKSSSAVALCFVPGGKVEDFFPSPDDEEVEEKELQEYEDTDVEIDGNGKATVKPKAKAKTKAKKK